MKWVIYAFVLQIPIWIVALFALSALRGSLSVQAYSLASLIGGATVSFAQLLVPLSFAIAILRYRLWDIDLIINRTLIYVPLTGILAGVYAASIATLQRLFQAFTGQKSDAAVVLTTLLLVGIFEPVKDRLKRGVERRYREPQDPLAPIESFGNQVSHVVDVFEPSRVTQQVLTDGRSCPAGVRRGGLPGAGRAAAAGVCLRRMEYWRGGGGAPRSRPTASASADCNLRLARMARPIARCEV